VHRRHRLGHWPQLRRLRPARERRDGRDVRGRARLAAERSLLVDRRAPRRHDSLHRADRHPRVHAVGHRVAEAPRPLVPAPARQRRGADQSRSVGLVLPRHRRRPLPRRRHVVADGDGHDHDHAAAGRLGAQARIRDASVSRHRRRDPHGTRREGGSGRRSARADAPVAVDAPRHLRRSRTIREPVLEQMGAGRLRHGRRARSATPTATSGSSAAWTT